MDWIGSRGGLGRRMHSMRKWLDGILAVRIWQVGLLLIILLALLPLRYNDAYITLSAINKQREIGDAKFNNLFYAYNSQYGFRGKILTDYQLFYGLPDINRYYQLGYTNQTGYLQQLALPEVAYSLFCTDVAAPKLVEYMQNKIASGEYKQIFEYACWHFVSLCKNTCQ